MFFKLKNVSFFFQIGFFRITLEKMKDLNLINIWLFNLPDKNLTYN